MADGTLVDDSYWDLVTSDIGHALSNLRPVYDQSDGIDGYVSVEVAPSLARAPPAPSSRPVTSTAPSTPPTST